ncbi:MAG: hypothetical protein L0Y72_29750 [Gemmataceae bacterium]|nr:hypothetical protein [Gemmataceae bacterium]
MKERMRNSRNCILGAGVFLALGIMMAVASPAWSGGKPAPSVRTPKLREVVEIPEDYYGRKFTFSVRVSTKQGWIRRGSSGDFFIAVQDDEGSALPNHGIGPDSTVNIIRFLLPKEEGRKLFERLSAEKLYEARITFTIDRERPVLGPGWVYLARISSVELR